MLVDVRVKGQRLRSSSLSVPHRVSDRDHRRDAGDEVPLRSSRFGESVDDFGELYR